MGSRRLCELFMGVALAAISARRQRTLPENRSGAWVMTN